MGKRLLIIGGTYFAGRIFALTASEQGHSITLMNRGTVSPPKVQGMAIYNCDRRDTQGIKQMPQPFFDVIVDFCAYQPGDVELLLTNIPAQYNHYILVSTASVYKRNSLEQVDETTPLREAKAFGPVEAYIFNKIQLESEAVRFCKTKGVRLTILRPVFIYGPFNYAPRESYFIKKIISGQSIPYPVDADSEFQFVFVRDLAQAILACIKYQKSMVEVFNLAAPEIFTYEKYMEVLESTTCREVYKHSTTVSEVLEKRIALPFPLLKSESETCCGKKITELLPFAYTSFQEGFKETYHIFEQIFIDISG